MIRETSGMLKSRDRSQTANASSAGVHVGRAR